LTNVGSIMNAWKAKPEQIRPGKESLQRIVRMLMGLIKRNSTREYDNRNVAK